MVILLDIKVLFSLTIIIAQLKNQWQHNKGIYDSLECGHHTFYTSYDGRTSTPSSSTPCAAVMSTSNQNQKKNCNICLWIHFWSCFVSNKLNWRDELSQKKKKTLIYSHRCLPNNNTAFAHREYSLFLGSAKYCPLGFGFAKANSVALILLFNGRRRGRRWSCKIKSVY